MNGSSPDHEKKKERFRIAFQTRQFEIDLLWKRSLFFRGFIGASFVAIASLKKEQPVLALLISGFGLVCSLSWTLVDRGSKYWQEHWESKAEIAEDDVTGSHGRASSFWPQRWFPLPQALHPFPDARFAASHLR
jgi:hypothetical protein